MSFSLASTVKHHPLFPYETIKNDILGKRYQLSLQFVGARRAAELNRLYRKKTYTPNVLSFPLAPDTGEIFICPHVAVKEAAAYKLSTDGYVAFLFIHGCLHLKGLDHGTTMDKAEQKYLTRHRIA